MFMPMNLYFSDQNSVHDARNGVQLPANVVTGKTTYAMQMTI